MIAHYSCTIQAYSVLELLYVALERFITMRMDKMDHWVELALV
jgi:hypothetical protein